MGKILEVSEVSEVKEVKEVISEYPKPNLW
jgi:hypothetical protein